MRTSLNMLKIVKVLNSDNLKRRCSICNIQGKDGLIMTRLPYHLFDLYPYKVSSFDELPFLEKELSRACAFIATPVATLLTSAVILSDRRGSDPIWKISATSDISVKMFIILVATLLFFSILFAFKQYEYYYGESDEPGKKSGVFRRKIKEINRAERLVDIILATTSGLLFSFSLLPTFWFLVLSIYSLVCVIRFYITLKRNYFISRLKKKLRPFYYKTMERKHNGMKVKDILCGWIISFVILGSIGLSTFVFLMISTISGYYNLMIAFILLALTFGFSFFFGNMSLDIGKKLAKWRLFN